MNKAKEFIVPNMTVLLREKAMKLIAAKHEKMEESNYNESMTKYIIAVSLNEVDDSKTSEQYVDCINQMHPDDLIELFTVIWNSGKKTKGGKAKFR